MVIDKFLANPGLPTRNRLLLATGVFAFALLVRFLVLPVEAGLAFLIFYPGTAVVALLCGFAVSMAYIFLSAIAGAIIFIPPYWQLEADKVVPIVAFWLSATTILLIVNFYQRRVLREAIKLAEEASLRQTISAQLLESIDFITDLESSFRQTFEQAAVGIAHVAPDGRWLMVNRKLCDIVGCDKESILQNKFTDIIHSGDLLKESENIQKVLSGTVDNCTMEIRCMHAAGKAVWSQLTVSLVKHADGAPNYFIVVVEDIQQRKQADEALKASEILFSTMLEQSPDAIAITTNEQGSMFIEVNSAFCSLSGYPREELLGSKLSELQIWGNQLQGLATLAMLSQGVPIDDLQSDLRCKEGRLIPTSLSARRIQLSSGERFMIIRRDITERMLSQERLKESEERWRFAVEGHGDALWDWDLITNNVYRSMRLLELCGTPDAPSTCPLSVLVQFVHPDDLSLVSDKFRFVLNGREAEVVGECRILREDGEMRWISFRCHVMRRNSNNKVERIIGTVRDISLRKRRQREMDIQMSKLSHQARLLSLGEMASATAHEINQPLTAIASYASACLRQLADRPKVQAIVQRIEEQALRAGTIVWRMRDFAKLRTTQRQKIALSGLIVDIFDWLAWDRRAQDCELISHIPIDLPDVFADRVQIEQVLMNLIGNGIEAMVDMPEKHVIEVAASLNVAKNEITVSVADRGCGLPEHVLAESFSPFVSSKPDGLGLGLSISRSIVSLHGGQLWAEARAGGGSIFYFSLPLDDKASTSEPEAPSLFE